MLKSLPEIKISLDSGNISACTEEKNKTLTPDPILKLVVGITNCSGINRMWAYIMSSPAVQQCIKTRQFFLFVTRWGNLSEIIWCQPQQYGTKHTALWSSCYAVIYLVPAHCTSYRFWKEKGMCLSDSNLTVWAPVHCKLGIPVSFFPMHHIQQQQLSDMQTTIHHSLTFQLGCVPILYHFGVIYTLQSEDLCFFHRLHVLASFLHLKRKKKKKWSDDPVGQSCKYRI